MLDLGRYLLGVAEVGLLAGFAILGATRLRSRLLPGFLGAPAHLASAVLALALLVLVAEVLGSFGLLEPVPYVLATVLVGLGVWTLGRGSDAGPQGTATTRSNGIRALTLVALLIAAIATLHFAGGVRLRLDTGMTGFDSTWYHGPFAAGFFQSGSTWNLHFIAPQFLAWFYPANSELFHAVGMLAFGRDILSPLLNLGWFAGCLFACWCIGRPYDVAPASLALGAVALSVPALSDQAGEARNDIVGMFFLLAAAAIVLNAWASRSEEEAGLSAGPLIVAGLAAGLAAGTKLNFLLPCAVLVIGLVAIAPKGSRWKAAAAAGPAALVGGGYWYLRNLAHAGNPLPWFDHLGPFSLPAPAQALGGREAHDILGYLTDGGIWSGWFLPGLHHGLGLVWPLLGALALAGLLLCLGRGAGSPLRVASLVGLAVLFAWLIAPTSASGPTGTPRGFESGLRYLAPALVLGLALLPTAPALRRRLASPGSVWTKSVPYTGIKYVHTGRGLAVGIGVGALALAVAAGYPVQRHYLQGRYANPSFTTPGLNAAFKWAGSISGARIATTSTRQYPLFGTDLSNHVSYVGLERPHGGFVAPETCRTWRRLLNEGSYDYVVASRDRVEPGRSAYPASAGWTEGPATRIVLRRPPTVVFRITGKLDPRSCGSSGLYDARVR